MIAALKAMVAMAHTQNVRILLGTILPFGGSDHSSPSGEQVRSEVNEWIRLAEGTDGVVDFDEVLWDAANQTKISPIYDFGAHLHPNDAGNARMAEFAYRALVPARL